MRTNDCIAAVVSELHQVGITPKVIAGGKHPRIRWTNAKGEFRTVFVAGSPSDHRAKMNSRRDVRRILKQDGVIL